ncbi:hypothetical protein AJ78_05337 [Emergomyces pasteurianus Ep9510]|uniref:C2H2-type domain-containing protein n=1 Tax=Emergomyces pasteurianus Ep9510 TaxID=1447872 RepID=A0A1J9PCL1_9EURO|nr:hypothetical protein AJ78_05337 [Emergomyces pasteurianus Ep9510]
MAQTYRLNPPGPRTLHITVPDAHSQSTLTGNSDWDSGDAFQRMMDMDTSPSHNNMEPAPASSPCETNSGSHPAPSPSWSFGSNSINCISLGQDSTTDLNSACRGAWNSVQITGIPNNVAPGYEHKRQRISFPDVSSSENVGKITPELGSQVNGHPASDSGYATRSARSMSGASPFPVVHTVHPPMTEPTCNTPYDFSPLQNQYFYSFEQHQPNWQGNPEAMPQVNDPQLGCDVAGCEWTGKCQSDKKKHMLRHQKRFRCRAKGCPRKEGFGTINDLERHQKTRHNMEPKHGSKEEFKCFAKNCTRKEKIWLRKDNFKYHLERMHIDEDPEELIQRALIWYESTKQSKMNSSRVLHLPVCSPQQEVIDPSSYRPSVLHDMTQFDNYQPQPCETISMYNKTSSNAPPHPPSRIRSENADLLSRYSNNNANPVPAEPEMQNISKLGEDDSSRRIHEFGWDDIEINQNSSQHIDLNSGRRPSSPFLNEMIEDHNLPSDMDSVTKAVVALFKALKKDGPKPRSGQPQTGNSNGSFKPADADATPALQQVNASGTLSYTDPLHDGSKSSKRYALRELLKASLKHLETSQANTDVPPTEKNLPASNDANNDGSPRRRGKKTFVCRYQGCTRKTGRLSEMKKHEKRHSRPYGCTYPRCFKSFGSKNDWKRHENTQHFQLQCWRCPAKIPPVNEGAGNDETLLERPDQEDLPQAFHLDRTRVDCARIFDRKDKFCHHLQSEHFYSEREAKQTAKDNEIGRNGQFKFWCGFCRKLIRLNKDGLDAWDERFDHIDNEHFKKKQGIGSWLHPEGHLTKKCEETEQMAGGGSETSVEAEGANHRSNDGGEEEATNDKGPVAPNLPVHNSPVSIQPLAANSHQFPAPAAARQAGTRAVHNANARQATKRKYDSVMASSPLDNNTGNNTIAHQTLPFSTPMMHVPQQQMISTQVAMPSGGRGVYRTSSNPFVPNIDYTNLNGLIPVENNFPMCALITCVRNCSANAPPEQASI